MATSDGVRMSFSEPKALEQALMLRATSGLGDLCGVPSLVGAEMFEPAATLISAEEWESLWRVEPARWPARASEYPEPMYLALGAAGVSRDRVRAWTARTRPTGLADDAARLRHGTPRSEPLSRDTRRPAAALLSTDRCHAAPERRRMWMSAD